jgi:uncharacterized membrane protein
MDETIHQLKKEELIDLKDAAAVIRKPDGKIKVKQATHLVGAGAVGGAITGSLSDYGINDDFIKEVGANIIPGGSALFLLISKWTEDKALERLKKFNATIVKTSLSNEDELKLKTAFGAGE